MPRESQRDRIVADLRRRVGVGKEFPPGSKLPSTRELIVEYRRILTDPDLSQGPVQAAVERLKWDGLLIGRQGIGVFVAEPSQSGPDE